VIIFIIESIKGIAYKWENWLAWDILAPMSLTQTGGASNTADRCPILITLLCDGNVVIVKFIYLF